jgi:rubrerythrin
MKIEQIYSSVEKEEEFAYGYYKDLIKAIKNESIKVILMDIADQELNHKRFLEQNEILILKKVNPKEIEKLYEDITNREIAPSNEEGIITKINFAIGAEIKAQKTYALFAEQINDTELKIQIKEFAKQEAHHKKLLELIKTKIEKSSVKNKSA